MLRAHRLLFASLSAPDFAAILTFKLIPIIPLDYMTFLRLIRDVAAGSRFPDSLGRNILVRAEVLITAAPAVAIVEIMRLPLGDGLRSGLLPFPSTIVTSVTDCAHAGSGVALVIDFAIGRIAPALPDV